MGRNVPQLRFPEFTSEWEEKTLGDIFTFYSTNSLSRDKLNYTGGPYKNIHYGDIHMIFPTVLNVSETEIPYINDGVKVKLTDDNFVQDGDIAIADASEDYADIGKAIEIVGVGDEKLVCGLHTLHGRDLNKVMINGFKGYLLRTPKVRRQMMTLCAGAKVLGISKDNINSVSVNIPSKEEQEKIKNLLVAYDNLIRNQEGKISALKERKQGLLKKIFTQQVRFKDQDGNDYPAWEEKTLGDICDFLDEKRKPLEAGEREPGEYPYYGASGIIDYVKDYIFDERLVLLSEDGANILDRNYPVCFIAEGKYWVNNHAHVLKVHKGYVDSLVCEAVELLRFNKYNTGTAQPKLNKEVCKKLPIKLPSFEEQKKIANVLSVFDKKIEVEQEILNNMQEFKKGLLQKMFI